MKNKSYHRPLLLLLVISIVPVILGTLLYYYHDHFQFKTMNYGTLINPPVSVAALTEALPHAKKWQIVYVPNHCCDHECDQTMFTLHQLRKTFGKEHDRINLVLAAAKTCQIKEIHDFERGKIQSSLQTVMTANKIYLVDPLGNLFMSYPSTVNAMNILKDLKRVLEVSQIG